ncbi:slc25a42 [Symbiodinium necroappetens]|uniref:Slc25a42 protein n=1 Tax=Symbiodinium necroappetens TaxID=1628268 RepID=A0A813BSK0_9DINO|nr:slc25a42 [Symbiodinium necroappetens]
MLLRPEETYNRKTGHKRSKNPQQYFLTSPTDPKTSSPQRRSPRAAKLRLRLKKCRSSKLLLDLLRAACDAGRVDISIFSAAVQRCGQMRWWRPLQDILQMQHKAQVKLDCVHVSSVLNALATCLRRDGKFEVVPARAQAALKIAHEVIEECKGLVQTESDYNILLTALFKLCSQIASVRSHQWALRIWDWSSATAFEKDSLTWTAFLTLSEQFGDESLVDRYLQEGLSDGASWTRNPVLLGGLLNAAANRRRAARADAIWDNFCSAGLRPNMICYGAYSKAHMLAGSPVRAVEIIDNMEMQKVANMNSNIVVDYGQCLLVVCHSSTSPSNRQKLLDFIARGDKIMTKDGRGNTKNEWQKIRGNAGKLLANAKSLQLQDILSEWKARTLSVMKDWENFDANTKYLKIKAPAYSSEDDSLDSGS